MSIGNALSALGVENYRLAGEPTSEEEFQSLFVKYIGRDENEVAIESSDPSDFGVTWEQIEAKLIELETEIPLTELRTERTRRLEETDWWALSDQTMTEEQIEYRQALRDITENYTSLDNVVWPEKP
jgi:hypothetical protein